ncbi:peptidase S8 and S53 subtilisin kexin sedolisin [Gemmatirosa kalamazoonensis]|uniref:Peptidase S8 and S53 subtilisin kexin sedolisin n=1 Tax=Gemmatirosa kalamazoonensis TaxID=861299 RepID=W0RB61_9BACT|nr:PKD domain-containing protein [Gemmatirosa kalamazoonensis]AHG88329.1 peptidase S8 and S53 subtilisin kexin sedolisin [Gemmatirosa kalamazoonensis]
MRLRRSLLLVLAAAVACTDTTLGPASGGGSAVEMPVELLPAVADPTPPAPEAAARTLVMLDEEGTEPVLAVARALLADHAPDAGARADSIEPLLASRGFVAPLTPTEAAAVAGDARVAYSEPPRTVTLDDVAAWTAPVGRGVFGQHTALLGLSAPPWALDRITQRALPLDGAATFTGDGDGVTIYVVDTGVRASHAEYAGRVTYGPDYIDGGTTSGDCNGHGTKVASDAAGATMGTARQADIVAVRVLDCAGSGSSVGIVQAIDWVIDQVRRHPGPAVINMSLGITGVCVPVNQAVAQATQAGIAVVVAAGNSDANACGFSPAGEPTAITVGATDVSDNRASFSNWGSCVDLWAPGANVDGADASGDHAYAPWSGTSAASPYAAGVATLYLAQFPAATPAQVSAALGAGATSGAIRGANVTNNRLLYLPASGSAPNPGTAGGTPGTFVSPPTARASITCARRSCTFDGRASTDAERIAKWAWTYGETGTGSTATTTHKYQVDGTYIARLTVTNARGLTASRQDTVRVTDGAPTARATVTCTGWTCRFDASRSTDDGKVTRYAWTYGDGSASAGTATSHAYRTAGTYAATLTVTDDVGQSSQVQISAATTPRPPTATARVTCTGRTCTFDASASRDDIGIASYTWDFLDGSLQTGGRVTRSYSTAGTKQFRLTVLNTSNIATTVTGKFTLR